VAELIYTVTTYWD